MPARRLDLILRVVGMTGEVAITIAILPYLLDLEELPVPLWLMGLIDVAQRGTYLGLAIWAGVNPAPGESSVGSLAHLPSRSPGCWSRADWGPYPTICRRGCWHESSTAGLPKDC